MTSTNHNNLVQSALHIHNKLGGSFETYLCTLNVIGCRVWFATRLIVTSGLAVGTSGQMSSCRQPWRLSDQGRWRHMLQHSSFASLPAHSMTTWKARAKGDMGDTQRSSHVQRRKRLQHLARFCRSLGTLWLRTLLVSLCGTTSLHAGERIPSEIPLLVTTGGVVSALLVRSSHVTAVEVPSPLSMVGYFSRYLQRENAAKMKDSRGVKPRYYGEALTHNDVIQRMEEEEQQKGKRKPQEEKEERENPNSSSTEWSQCRCWK